MKQLTFPSVYCLRTPSISQLMFSLIRGWAGETELSEFPALCWLTSMPNAEAFDGLSEVLASRSRKLKGLDVIEVSPQSSQQPIRELARMLGQVCPLRPAVVFVDRLDCWLNERGWQIQKVDAFQQIQRLGRWCAKNGITIVALAETELPVWSSLTNGLEDVDEQGKGLLTHWWHFPWGYAGSLWNDPDKSDDHAEFICLDSSAFATLGNLAREIYMLRIQSEPGTQIHVWLKDETRELLIPALLRLGADTVFSDQEGWSRHMGGSVSFAARGHALKKPDADSQTQDAFNVTLQEILTPGQLKFVTAPEFAALGHLLINQAKEWGLHCSLSRLSLLRHVTALHACRLADALNLQGCALATQEAIYFFRLCNDQTTSHEIDEWLKNRFVAPMASLFAGVSHYTQTSSMQNVLNSLHDYETSVVSDDLTEVENMEEASTLSDLWNAESLPAHSRPWLKRISSLSGLDLTADNNADSMKEH